MKKCPHCAEEIQDEARKCRYCGERLSEEAAPRTPVLPKKTVPITKPRAKSRFPLVFLMLEIGGIVFFGVAATQFGWKAIVSAIVFAVLAPVAWAIGDMVRQFAMPSMYFASGMQDMIKKKLFWMYGPQVAGVVVLGAVLMLWVNGGWDNHARSATTTPAFQAETLPTPSVEPALNQAGLQTSSDNSDAADVAEDAADAADAAEMTEIQAQPAAGNDSQQPESRSESAVLRNDEENAPKSTPGSAEELQPVARIRTYYAVVEGEGGRYEYIEVEAVDEQKALEVIRDFRGNPKIIESPKLRN